MVWFTWSFIWIYWISSRSRCDMTHHRIDRVTVQQWICSWIALTDQLHNVVQTTLFFEGDSTTKPSVSIWKIAGGMQMADPILHWHGIPAFDWSSFRIALTDHGDSCCCYTLNWSVVDHCWLFSWNLMNLVLYVLVCQLVVIQNRKQEGQQVKSPDSATLLKAASSRWQLLGQNSRWKTAERTGVSSMRVTVIGPSSIQLGQEPRHG